MKLLQLNAVLLSITILVLCCNSLENNGIHVVNLKCENHVNPIAIDRSTPLLSWNLVSDEKDQKQLAYQILVSGSEENLKKDLGEFWDSGKVISDESINIIYSTG